MNFQISYHHDIPKDIARIPQNIKGRIHRSIEERLLKDPYHFGLPLRKSLRGYRKLRIGDYRVIYKIVKNEITILKIGHRKNVYEDADERESDQLE